MPQQIEAQFEQFVELSSEETGRICGGSADSIDPILMVISNQDFWYQDYADTRSAQTARRR